MDSDNSGSVQSSSGGDEEYDSRATAEDSISAFVNIHPTVTVPHASLIPSPTLFDPIFLYPDLTPPSFFHPSMSWPRSDPIYACSTTFTSSPFQADNNSGFAAPPVPPVAVASRNPKKRSRASRRAPTTVLTTDTSNFRAMVQEFTGIPAPPFSSPLSRNRLDISALPPSYLRRPFPQKVHSPPSFPVSAPSSSPVLTEPSSTVTAPSIQLPFPQPSNLYNISNPVLSSLLQSNAKYPFSGSFLHGIKPPEIPSSDHSCNIKVGRLDEFGAGLGHENSALQNLISSNPNAPRNDRNKTSSPAYGNDHQDQTGLVNGVYGSFTGNSNINYSDSPSNLPSEKGTENVTRKSEGMMEPWNCSSK